MQDLEIFEICTFYETIFSFGLDSVVADEGVTWTSVNVTLTFVTVAGLEAMTVVTGAVMIAATVAATIGVTVAEMTAVTVAGTIVVTVVVGTVAVAGTGHARPVTGRRKSRE